MKIFITICLIGLIKYSVCGHFDNILPAWKTVEYEGVRIIMKGSTLADVQDLVSHIQNNKRMNEVTIYADGVDDKRMGLLANALGNTSIGILGLHSFGDHELQIIAKIFPEMPLWYLRIIGGNISLSGAEALAEKLNESSIGRFEIQGTEVTDEGFKVIVDILPLTRISTLHLWDNRVSDLAMEYLGAMLDKTHLKHLSLSNITDEVYNKLKKVKGNTNINLFPKFEKVV